MAPYNILLVALCVAIHLGDALTCFSCDNVGDMLECTFKGKLETCRKNQKSCETVVRRRQTKYTIYKGCKQTHACLENAKFQVTIKREYGFSSACNEDRETSVCTCCCQTDSCNLGNSPCTGMTFPCDTLQQPEGGSMTCTSGSDLSSVCSFNCSDSEAATRNGSVVCLRSGVWSGPKPCCARPCPPYLNKDVVFLGQANNESQWNRFKQAVASFVGQVNIGSDAARIGVVSFGSSVHGDSEIKLSDYTSDKTSLLAAIDAMPFVDEGDAPETGKALTYIRDSFFSVGDRASSKNVIVVISNSPSTDKVNNPAYTLRQRGFTIYVVVPEAAKNDPLFFEQSYDMIGQSGRVYYEMFPGDVTYLEDLMTSVCINPCDY